MQAKSGQPIRNDSRFDDKTNGGSADDFRFTPETPMEKINEEPNHFASTETNETICSFFREMLSRWLQKTQVENVEVAVRDIVTSLNGRSDGGIY